jgi:hypothetical protein
MTGAAITHGSLVDVRNVNQHKCVRLVIDIPAERAREIIDTFGWPTMVDPVPVAIARLAPSATNQEAESAPSKAQIPTAQPRQSTPAGATYAQRLGIACNEPAFWQFLKGRLPAKSFLQVTNDKEAADVVRWVCGVKSRSETIKGSEAGDKARDLLLDYDNFVRGAA